jgi:CheY-like chemotaxis protein
MKTKKILLIEDDYFIYELYERVLTKEGYEVTCAKDGKQGIEKANKDYNLILLDVMMPKMNGIDVLKNLKQRPELKNIPVVLLTNLGQESVIKQAFKLGASGYFMKMRLTPYDLASQIKQFFEDPSFKMNPNGLNLD